MYEIPKSKQQDKFERTAKIILELLLNLDEDELTVIMEYTMEMYLEHVKREAEHDMNKITKRV